MTDLISAKSLDAFLPEELERVSTCAACGGAEFEPKYQDLGDLLAGVPGRWGFVVCRSCAALHLDPRPRREVVQKAYPQGYVTHQSNLGVETGNGVIWKLANGYLRWRFGSSSAPFHRVGRWVVPLIIPIKLQLDYHYRHLRRAPGALLDVGCGSGAFLSRARDAGWRVQGIEPDPAAARQARAAGLEVACTSIEEFKPDRQFDRITLSHVLEHLHDPDRALRLCRDWLRPRGELWLSLPNPTGLGHRIFGSSWFALDPPRHLVLPTPARVHAMLASSGFESIRFMRRGRGARSSIYPSAEYARRRGTRTFAARPLSYVIDCLASAFPKFSEETVVLATRRPER